MTEIEAKALALVNEVSDGFRDVASIYDIHTAKTLRSALCRAIEQHEAFKQEVSDVLDAVVSSTFIPAPAFHKLRRFIIAKPDPLVEALKHWSEKEVGFVEAESLRAALAKRGLEIVEKK